jgi:hypothetical protein
MMGWFSANACALDEAADRIASVLRTGQPGGFFGSASVHPRLAGSE